MTSPDQKLTPDRDIAAAFQAVSLSNGADRQEQQHGNNHQLVTSLNTRPSLPLYSFMFQPSMAAGIPVLFDGTPQAGQIGQVTPLTPPFPIGRPAYHAPPSPALTIHTEFSPSRAMPCYGRIDARRQNAARITRSPYHNAASHHNHVDISRIRDGIDVRTTVSPKSPEFGEFSEMNRSCFETFQTRSTK